MWPSIGSPGNIPPSFSFSSSPFKYVEILLITMLSSPDVLNSWKGKNMMVWKKQSIASPNEWKMGIYLSVFPSHKRKTIRLFILKRNIRSVNYCDHLCFACRQWKIENGMIAFFFLYVTHHNDSQPIWTHWLFWTIVIPEKSEKFDVSLHKQVSE